MYYFNPGNAPKKNTRKIILTQFWSEYVNSPSYENDDFPEGFSDEAVWEDHMNIFDSPEKVTELYGSVRIL